MSAKVIGIENGKVSVNVKPDNVPKGNLGGGGMIVQFDTKEQADAFVKKENKETESTSNNNVLYFALGAAGLVALGILFRKNISSVFKNGKKATESIINDAQAVVKNKGTTKKTVNNISSKVNNSPTPPNVTKSQATKATTISDEIAELAKTAKTEHDKEWVEITKEYYQATTNEGRRNIIMTNMSKFNDLKLPKLEALAQKQGDTELLAAVRAEQLKRIPQNAQGLVLRGEQRISQVPHPQAQEVYAEVIEPKFNNGILPSRFISHKLAKEVDTIVASMPTTIKLNKEELTLVNELKGRDPETVKSILQQLTDLAHDLRWAKHIDEDKIVHITALQNYKLVLDKMESINSPELIQLMKFNGFGTRIPNHFSGFNDRMLPSLEQMQKLQNTTDQHQIMEQLKNFLI